jgi:hypothetical protein
MAQIAPEDRLGKLEKTVRFWRFMTMGLGIALAVVTLGQGWLDYSGWRTFRTRRLEVVGDNGLVASISGEKPGGLVTVFNAQGMPRLLMGSSKADSGQIEIHGKNDDRAALLWGTSSGGMLVLFNSDARPVVDIQSDRRNSGIVAVHDYNGNYREGLVGDRR